MYFMTREWESWRGLDLDSTPRPVLQGSVKLQGPLAGNPSQWKNVSRDGERFIFAMPATPASAAR